MKFKTVKVLLFIAVTIVMFSCKKKKDTVEKNEGKQINAPERFNPTHLNGQIRKGLTYHFELDTFRLRAGELYAAFYDKAIHRDSIFYSPYAREVGNIFLNDTMLDQYQNIGGYYYGYYNEWNPEYLGGYSKWKVTGKGDFLAFNYADNTALPYFAGAKQIIDTLYLGKTNTLKIKHYKNVDRIEVLVTSSFCYGQTSNILTLTPPLEEIKLEPHDLWMINACIQPFVSIIVRFYKNNYQQVNNLALNFETVATFRLDMIPVTY
jgi:hypothetical protein